MPQQQLGSGHGSTHRPLSGSDPLALDDHPDAQNYLGWTGKPSTFGTLDSKTSGTPSLHKILTPKAFTCNTIVTSLSNTATLIVGGQNCLALFDSTGASLYRSSTYSVTTIGGVGGAYIAGDAVTQASTSGAGTGFTATVKTLNGNGVGTLTTTAVGAGYANGDTITLSNAHGGTGAVLTLVVDNGSYQLIDVVLAAGGGLPSVATGGVSVATAFVWAVFLFNSTGTVPQSVYSGQGLSYITNAGLSVATSLAATWGTTKTSLATSFTPSSALTQNGRLNWFALS